MCLCKHKTGPGQGLQAWVGPKPHFNGLHVTRAYVVSDKQGSHLGTLELLQADCLCIGVLFILVLSYSYVHAKVI